MKGFVPSREKKKSIIKDWICLLELFIRASNAGDSQYVGDGSVKTDGTQKQHGMSASTASCE
jgi:hypothetical protein